MTLEEFLRQQEADSATLERTYTALENKIAALDPRLRPDALREETAKLRAAASDALRHLAVAMNNRAQAAQAMARTYTREAELRLARFHADDAVNATMQMSLLMRLGKTPTGELIEHLRDAVASKNLARVEAVRLEFESREAELVALGPEQREAARRAFREEFARLEVPQAAAAKQTINKIAQLAAFGQERFTAATSGRPDPVARMTAARMAAA
jgi:hypothetical protein